MTVHPSLKLKTLPGRSLHGEYRLPGDKSLSHRMALFAALAEGQSCMSNFLVSGVTQAMLSVLTAIGVDWELKDDQLTVWGKGFSGLKPPRAVLDCGNSATTLRLLAGALAAANLPAILDGSDGLRRRPMERILTPLCQMGVNITGSSGCAPLQITPTALPLKAVDYSLPVASAQVKSCLLLAALSAGGPVFLREPGPSRDHTERLLHAMGVELRSWIEYAQGEDKTQYFTRLDPLIGRSLLPLNMSIPGDISSAAFLIVAALVVPGSEILLRNVGLNPTRTGLLDALWAMQADIKVLNPNSGPGEPCGDLLIRSSQLHGTQVAGPLVVRMIDEFPAFAVAAAFAEGETVVSEAEELRYKESDRISALCQEFNRLGIRIQEASDGFTVAGGEQPIGGEVDPHGDHRLAMALGLVGLASRRLVTVLGAEVINESFPEFVSVLQSFGADLLLET
jgi:3-phosphoshikimate 1-carboxyvinyltransferase